MHADFRRSLRREALLYISTAAVPRLELGENSRTSLGPGFFSTLLGRVGRQAMPAAFSAARTVCWINIEIVIGPTPPGTGV